MMRWATWVRLTKNNHFIRPCKVETRSSSQGGDEENEDAPVLMKSIDYRHA